MKKNPSTFCNDALHTVLHYQFSSLWHWWTNYLKLADWSFTFHNTEFKGHHPYRHTLPPLSASLVPHPGGGIYHWHAPRWSSLCGIHSAQPFLLAQQAQPVQYEIKLKFCVLMQMSRISQHNTLYIQNVYRISQCTPILFTWLASSRISIRWEADLQSERVTSVMDVPVFLKGCKSRINIWAYTLHDVHPTQYNATRSHILTQSDVLNQHEAHRP